MSTGDSSLACDAFEGGMGQRFSSLFRLSSERARKYWSSLKLHLCRYPMGQGIAIFIKVRTLSHKFCVSLIAAGPSCLAQYSPLGTLLFFVVMMVTDHGSRVVRDVSSASSGFRVRVSAAE